MRKSELLNSVIVYKSSGISELQKDGSCPAAASIEINGMLWAGWGISSLAGESIGPSPSRSQLGEIPKSEDRIS